MKSLAFGHASGDFLTLHKVLQHKRERCDKAAYRSEIRIVLSNWYFTVVKN